MNNNSNVRAKNPLVHCITNYVTVNDVANILLACGGSPIMTDDINDVGEIVSISSALVINIGTLNERTIKSMLKAGETANKNGTPVVLDPVGAGASTLRNETTMQLLKNVKFSVIRGNLSEVSFIAGLSSSTRGVDSNEKDNKNNSIDVAKKVANEYNCVCAITGAIDVITDGKRIAKVYNGTPLMSKVTGTGCMLSAVVGAYVGSGDDHFVATVNAIMSMGIAGEMSYEKHHKNGTGSFHIGIIDAMSIIDDAIIESKGKVVYENC